MRSRSAARSTSRSRRRPRAPNAARRRGADCPTRATAPGSTSFLTTLDAQRTAYAAQQHLVTTRLSRGSNLVELYRALGGGLDVDDPQVRPTTAAK